MFFDILHKYRSERKIERQVRRNKEISKIYDELEHTVINCITSNVKECTNITISGEHRTSNYKYEFGDTITAVGSDNSTYIFCFSEHRFKVSYFARCLLAKNLATYFNGSYSQNTKNIGAYDSQYYATVSWTIITSLGMKRNQTEKGDDSQFKSC